MGNTNTTELTLEEKKTRQAGYTRKYREANKEKIAEYREANKEKIAEYREANKEKIAEQKRRYNQANKEKIAEYHRQYRKANKERIAKRERKYARDNSESVNEYNRTYYSKNKEKIENRRQELHKEKIKQNNQYRLCLHLRQRQQKAMKGKYKTGSAVRDMGCTVQEACDHIESLFDKNMKWENWGTYWHLDHIFPLAKANMEDRVEYLAVSNWRNLQPLEAKANIAKGDKVTPAARRLFNKLVKEFS